MDYTTKVKGHKTKLAKLELIFFASDTRIRSASSTLVCFIDARLHSEHRIYLDALLLCAAMRACTVATKWLPIRRIMRVHGI